MLRKTWLYFVAALFVAEAALFVFEARANTVRVYCDCGGSVSCTGTNCGTTASSCECRNNNNQVESTGVCSQC